MRRARWLATWRYAHDKPVFYHCISRVVDRRFVMNAAEKEKFRTLMRCYEAFSGCRVISYCLMSNHFHLLVEVPPAPVDGLSDDELLKRLAAIYREGFVADVAQQLEEARINNWNSKRDELHRRFTYRMHSLAEFMKGLLQRYTQWHNRQHERSGRLWEDRFKSVIVEDGRAARMVSAYIDLNPVRAGMVSDPSRYSWSSYGEALGEGGGEKRGNRKLARAGLVRAWGGGDGKARESTLWWRYVAVEYKKILINSGLSIASGERLEEVIDSAQQEVEPKIAVMLHQRIRYFSDGAVIGGKNFVNEAFQQSRWRFGEKRRDGARKLRGSASPAREYLYSLRDLKKDV